MNQVFCFGDSCVKFFPRDSDVPLRDVSSFRRHLSGSAAVTAHVVATLGGRSAYLGAVAKDSFGDYIRRTLRTAGVDLAHLHLQPEADTPLLFTAGSSVGEEKLYRHNTPLRGVSSSHFEKVCMDETDTLFLEAASLSGSQLELVWSDLLEKARQANCLTSVDLCTLPGTEEDLSRLRKILLTLDSGLIFATQKSLSRLFETTAEDGCGRLLDQNCSVLIQGGPTGPVLHCSQFTVTDGKFHFPGHWALGKYAYQGGLLHVLAKSGTSAVLEDRQLSADAMCYAGAVAALAATKRGNILGYTAFEEVKNMLMKQEENPQQGLEAIKQLAKEDYYRLDYHVMPECGWMNDPNGLVEFAGEYHAFYQHYPNAPEWGPMHWGHVVSKDLLHWEYLPIALTPDQPYEKGCFSGSAVDDNGVLTLIYTAHDDEKSPKEKQCIATSTDGVTFHKYEGNPVVLPPKELGDDFRDPKVLFVNGRWHMVVGSTRQGKGCVAMFASDDLREWEYKGIICESNGNQGDMWECPDFFTLDGVDVLMFSPMNVKGSKTMFVTGKMDFATYTFTQERYYEVDYGHEFYAPQTFEDSNGRRILISWMEMWGNDFPTQKNGWAGALTLPRELYIKDGVVCQRPVRETESLRKETLCQGPLSLSAGKAGNLKKARGDCLEISLSANTLEHPDGKLALRLRASQDGKQFTAVTYDFASGELSVDKTQSGLGKQTVTTVEAPGEGGMVDLVVFVDKSSLEVFANGGRQVITTRIYPDPSSTLVDIQAVGADMELSRLDVYAL